MEYEAESAGVPNDQRFFKPASEQSGKDVGIYLRLKDALIVEQLGQCL